MSFLRANGFNLFLILILVLIWFSVLGINHMLAWNSLYVSFLWLFILIPAYCFSLRLSLPLMLVFGIYLESVYPDIRPLGLVTVFMGYLYVLYAKGRPYENFYRHLAISASVVNLVLFVVLSISVFFKYGNVGTYWYRLIQDLVLTQVVLMLSLPILGLALLMVQKRQAIA